ncbi:MAG: nicotinate-nucleotide diphosphorylase (carboxylating), partial [Balneolaceae bacterium]
NVGADIIMLDNMSIESMIKAVKLIDGHAETEASGNINYENIRQVAETGVNFISVGALTHSVRAFDISQRITEIF